MQVYPLSGIQIFLLMAQLWVLIALGHLMWRAWLRLPEHITAPFALRAGSAWASGGSLLLMLAHAAMPRWFSSPTLATAGWLLGGAALVMAVVALAGFKGRARAAVEAAAQASDFERLEVYRGMAEAFPGQIQPLLSQLHDLSTQRVLAQLVERGYKVGQRPLLEVVQARLRVQTDEVVLQASRFGLCRGDRELEARASATDEHRRQSGWEAILERRPGAPVVGHALRAAIEEALVRQDPRVGFLVSGPRLTDAASRHAVGLMRRRFQAVCAELGLEAAFDEAAEGLATVVEVEITEARVARFERQGLERRERRIQTVDENGTRRTRTEYTRELVTCEVLVPLLKLRARVLRQGRLLHMVEADSAPVASGLAPGHVPEQGALVQTTGDFLFDAISRGLGLRVQPQGVTLPVGVPAEAHHS